MQLVRAEVLQKIGFMESQRDGARRTFDSVLPDEVFSEAQMAYRRLVPLHTKRSVKGIRSAMSSAMSPEEGHLH